MKVIVFQAPISNTIGVMYPHPDMDINEVARKDVDEGKPYFIVDANELPDDQLFQSAWEIDFSNPDGYGIGHEAWVKEQENKQ